MVDCFHFFFWRGFLFGGLAIQQVENLEQKIDGLSEDYANKLADELKFLSTQTAVLKRLMTENKDE